MPCHCIRGDTNIKPTIQANIENVHDERIGGFTIPLPTTAEALQPFLTGAEIKGWQDMKIWEVTSDIGGLGEAVTGTMKKSMTPDTLDELNYLAARIGGLDEGKRDIFAAVIASGWRGDASSPEADPETSYSTHSSAAAPPASLL